MKKYLFNFFNEHNLDNPKLVDELIVSSFLNFNSVSVINNEFIKSFIIDFDSSEYSIYKEFYKLIEDNLVEFTFENLIELFEFVVSPLDKVINGAIYTPSHIREYIVQSIFEGYLDISPNIRVADISCGCGGFLLTVAKKINDRTGRSFEFIFRNNLFGIDIAGYSIERTKILLSLFAIINKEDVKEFKFNLFINNSLSFDWNSVRTIKENGGFDLIVGNPPYVCSRNMDEETMSLIARWEVSKSGHPDLYIPFFQIGIESLNTNGILGYITVNTFIKSVNGRALRKYFSSNSINLSIITFGGEQVFQDRNTYTCICFIHKGNGQVNFLRTESNQLNKVNLKKLYKFSYTNLNDKEGWNLVSNKDLLAFVNKIENTGIKFKNLYDTKNGIATLKNEVYKFTPVRSDNKYHYLNDEGEIFKIEKNICRDIVNANKLKNQDDITRLTEKIIFPYNELIKILSEEHLKINFPYAYEYLKTKQLLLATRDKGLRQYEKWYAYGRRQSMDINAYKLFFPHICERPTFVICENKELLFYNGIAIVSNDLEELKIIKRILESDLFFEYIKNTTKDYASGYISMSKNYLKNFGVYQFNEKEKKLLLKTKDLEGFLANYYL